MQIAVVRDSSGREFTCQVLGDELFPLADAGVLEVLAMDTDQRAEFGARSRDRRPLRLADVRLLPPVVPPALRDFMAYQHHYEGARHVVFSGAQDTAPAVWYEIPIFYFSNSHAVVGANGDVLSPPRSGVLDRMEAQINGRTVTRSSSLESAWSFADLIVYASRGAEVGAGDVIAAGTCPGGSLLDIWGASGEQDPPPLKPGDVVTMTVEGIGTISNTVKPAPPHHQIPPARRFHE